MNTVTVIIGFAVALTIAATILLYIYVIPEKKRNSLPKIGVVLHDIFTFKTLYIEKVLRFIYTVATVFCIIAGILLLFGFVSYDYGYGYSYTRWFGGYGILLMILGTVGLRLAYESLMMFILLVKNTIQINNKLSNKEEQISEKPAVSVEKTEVE